LKKKRSANESISPAIFYLPERLALTANAISGSIPSELGGLANIGKRVEALSVILISLCFLFFIRCNTAAFLAISRNTLGGQLPSELGLLKLLGECYVVVSKQGDLTGLYLEERLLILFIPFKSCYRDT
jgi:hypothetical protein